MCLHASLYSNPTIKKLNNLELQLIFRRSVMTQNPESSGRSFSSLQNSCVTDSRISNEEGEPRTFLSVRNLQLVFKNFLSLQNIFLCLLSDLFSFITVNWANLRNVSGILCAAKHCYLTLAT